jgi:hypothetical protein
MATIGKLAVQITADTKGLSTGLKGAGSEVDSFGTRIEGLATKLRTIGPVAAAAGAAFAVGMVRNVANTADALGKLSTRTGVAVEDLSRLQYAASLSDVSTQELSGGITRLSRSMSDAASGTGEAGKAFEAMGITIKNQDGTLRSQVDVLNDIADRFASYQDGAQKSALAQQIFGRAGTQLITVLNGGSQALKSMGEESDRLGNTIDQKTAKAAEQFNDDITRLSTAIGGLSRQIAGPVIQSLATASSHFIKLANDAGIAKAIVESFLSALQRTTGTDAIGVLQREAKLTSNAIALTNLQLEKFTNLANAGIPGASERVSELRLQMDGLLKKSAAAADKLKELANVAYTPVVGAALATPQIAAPSLPAKDDDAAKKSSEEAKKAAQDASDFIKQEENDQRQREIDNLIVFMDGLKVREEARLQSGLTEQQRAEEQYARELEQLIASKEALALTEEEFSERLLQIRMDRDEKIMNADIAMLDREKQIADERVRINQQAEQLIQNAREASTNAAIGLLSALGGKSKAAAVAAIALGKALSIAQIIQNTAVAQMRALAELGPLAGSAAAAKIGVMGKVQAGLVAATGLVQAAGVMSGGSQSLVAGNTIQQSANSGSPMQGNGMAAPSMNQTITVQGIGADSLFSGDAVRTLIDRLIDAQRNGARIVLA